MKKYYIEACVETLEEAQTAENKGADRIELCSNLEEDGLTPDKKLINQALDKLRIPIKVMIRPRSGDFCYNSDDILEIQRDIMICQNLGVDHIVFGAIKNNRLDIALIKQVATWALPMTMTVHKAIDVSLDPLNDIEALKPIRNIKAILSSGQKQTAAEGVFMLGEMLRVCGDRFELIPAGKITIDNLAQISGQLNARAFHGRRIL